MKIVKNKNAFFYYPGTSPLDVVLADCLSFLILVLVIVIPPSEPSPFMASTSILHIQHNNQEYS